MTGAKAEEIFDIVNDADEVTGTAPRSVAHRQGLRHRAIHVLFVTPDGNAILQRRSMSKDTYPGWLTVTVGGHVSSGGSYEATAVTEIFEETGLRLPIESLVPVSKLRCEYIDPITGAHDNEFMMVYGHVFRGKLSDLKIEPGEGTGFDLFPLARLMAMTEEERATEKIVPILSSPLHYRSLYEKFLGLV